MYGEKYRLGQRYMQVFEKFTQKNGERSCYDMMMGSGLFTLDYKRNKEEMIKQIIDKLRDVHYEIDEFEYKETQYGLELERYVKCIDLDEDKFEPGTIDDYTDHEKYTVEVFKVMETYGLDV